jgi:DNA repair photolyase
MSTKRKTGTREWADSNYNIGIGCSHNCRYCYARTNALRYRFVESSDAWTTEKIKDKMPPVSKKNGWIMFPTTHDISPYYLPYALEALKNLLSKGNKVLIVSKPHMVCVMEMCKELKPWAANILFRFTIGTPSEERAKFWEPGAPAISERFNCLKYAYSEGFSTSVSMEPMLGTVEETLDMFKKMESYVTDTIWIGKMNKINARVKKSSPEIAVACDEVIKWQGDENIMWLVNELKGNTKIAWKDSIKEVIEKRPLKI